MNIFHLVTYPVVTEPIEYGNNAKANTIYLFLRQ